MTLNGYSGGAGPNEKRAFAAAIEAAIKAKTGCTVGCPTVDWTLVTA